MGPQGWGGDMTDLIEEIYPNPRNYPLDRSVDPKDIYHWNNVGSQVITRWMDAQDGDIKLETIWYPLWDTAPVYDRTARRLTFFQTDGRANKTSPYFLPRLSHPKRYHIWEISFDAPDGEISQAMLQRAMVWCHIGEKNYLSVPFSALLCRPAPAGQIRRFIPLCTPLYLPPVQNWSVFLEWKPTEAEIPGGVTCTLSGYLHRGIC